jgi:hypothetical protein
MNLFDACSCVSAAKTIALGNSGVQLVSCFCPCRIVPYCAIENGQRVMTHVTTSTFPSENRLFRRRKENLPAEGLEPTRSCDHWILSPARLPFRHAGVSKTEQKNTGFAQKLKRFRPDLTAVNYGAVQKSRARQSRPANRMSILATQRCRFLFPAT